MSFQLVDFVSLPNLLDSYFRDTDYCRYNLLYNPRVCYIDEYLRKLGVKTVVIENDYIDRNFIDDYCGYYAKCFKNYPKKCKRLLFFNERFNQDSLFDAALNPSSESRYIIQSSFCGSAVLRPIPGAHLGNVCLSTYPPEAGKQRVFPLLRPYKAHFMGLDLEVMSVAFQEQDNVISACATSALWSAFHCLSALHAHDVPSPFQITQNAHKILIEPGEYNVLDKGLFPSQMAAAIADEGYSPLLNGCKSKSFLKAVCRAYLNVRQPVILGISLAYENEEDHTGCGKKNYIVGEHSVTVTGYRIKQDLPPVYSTGQILDPADTAYHNDIRLISSNIDKFYAHDDQIGPFASLIDRSEYWQRLETRWNYYKDPKDPIDASVNLLIIPSNKKIRIRFPLIFNFIARCNRQLKIVWNKLGRSLVWDPRLFTIADFKRRIANRQYFEADSDDLRFKVLSIRLPRFIWIVDLWQFNGNTKEQLLTTFIFDATDMESADYLCAVVHHSDFSYNLCKRRFTDLASQNPSPLDNQRTNRQLFIDLLNAYNTPDSPKILK